MTNAQMTLTNDTKKELEKLAPGVKWFVSYNYYTKLPEFSAVKDGAVRFGMWKQERRDTSSAYPRYTGEKYAELRATIEPNAKLNDEGGVLVSPGIQKPSVTLELPRLNFKKYIQFIKDNIGILESIGA